MWHYFKMADLFPILSYARGGLIQILYQNEKDYLAVTSTSFLINLTRYFDSSKGPRVCVQLYFYK